MATPHIIRTGSKAWENRHHTFTESIDDYSEMWNPDIDDILQAYNEMTTSVQEEIRLAIAGQKTMRALGGGWSWTRIATSHSGWMYSTRYLTNRFTLARPLVPNYAGNPDDLLFVQCGTTIHQLNSYLEEKGKALKTSGASNGQTLAGALGTGTHGSAIDFGAVPEFVVGIHLIAGPTNAHNLWLERRSQPVVSQRFAGMINATIVADDDTFNAALVSFGSFGFIHGILIETEPLSLLECYRQRIKDEPALYRLMETMDFSNAAFLPFNGVRPHHFQVTLNPYDMANGAYVTTMYKRPYTPDYIPPNSSSSTGLGDDVPSFIGTITDGLPAVVPTLVNAIIKNQYPLFTKQMGVRGQIFGDTELRGKVLSAAIGLPLSQLSRVREILFDLNANGAAGPFTGVFAFRFVKSSSATLGFTYFPPTTCVLELDGVYSKRIGDFYSQVWDRLDSEKIDYTFHWGKVNEMNPARLAAAFKGREMQWVQARKTLMDPDTMEVFNNDQIRAWGLC